MRRTIAAFVLILLAVASCGVQRSGGEDAVRRALREFQVAAQAKDEARLRTIIADDYQRLSYTPKLPAHGKERFVQILMKGDFRRADYNDVRVRMYGDTAIVTYQFVFNAVLDGGLSESGDVNNTDVWRYAHGRWQLALKHTSVRGCNCDTVDDDKLNVKFIPASAAKRVNLGTKTIDKYTPPDRKLEINRMRVVGRHPEREGHFVYEREVRFMLYVTKGQGTVYAGEKEFSVNIGDVLDIPPRTPFAVKSDELEYLTLEQPAWFPEQASICDAHGKPIAAE